MRWVKLILFLVLLVFLANISIAERVEFRPEIKNALNKNISATYSFYNDKSKIIRPLVNKSLEEGKYNLKVKIRSGPVKSIDIKGLNVSKPVIDFVKYDNTPESVKGKYGKWLEVYSIDPTSIEFDNITISVLAKGNKLYKCNEWNFTQRRCSGYWRKIKDITPGKIYQVVIYEGDPSYAEINLTNATHLNESYGFISSIYEDVKLLDGNWSDPINYSHYVRVFFEHDLEDGNVINTFVRGLNNENISCGFEVYEYNSTKIVGYSDMVDLGEVGRNVLVNNLTNPSDVFDLRIVGNDSNCYLEFDYIHDAITGLTLFADASAKPPVHSTKVQQDIVLRNASGRIFMMVNDTVCNTSSSANNQVSCRSPAFAVGNFQEPSCMINSRGRIACVYINRTAGGSFSTYTDNLGGTFSSPVRLPFPAGTNYTVLMSLAIDKEDMFHGCGINKSVDKQIYWMNSSDGIAWSVANVSYSDAGEPCDIELSPEGIIAIIAANTSGIITRLIYHNFTKSDDPNATRSTFDAGAGLTGRPFSLAIDQDDNIYVVMGSSTVVLTLYNSTLPSPTSVTEQFIPTTLSSGTDFTDIVVDNPRGLRILYQEDENTLDDSVRYINSSNGGASWSVDVELQDDDADPNADTGYAHQMGSSYPVFNKPTGRLHYFYWTDSGTNAWYYSNYSYVWSDIGMPDNRFSSSNATNGTTTTGSVVWFYTEGFDESNISSTIFSIDDGTDSFANVSQTNYSSPQYYQSKNFTYTITAGSGAKVRWRWHINDTYGNVHTSEIYSIDIPITESVGMRAMSSGMEVWTNVSSSNWHIVNYALLNGDNFYKNGSAIPSYYTGTGRDIYHLETEQSHIQNETALLTQQGSNLGNQETQFFNGSDWHSRLILQKGEPHMKIGDSCYRKDGSLVVASGNYTGGSRGNRYWRYWIKEGITWTNYTGLNIPGQSFVDYARAYCNENGNYTIITYSVASAVLYQPTRVVILDENNNLINDTSFGSVHTYNSASAIPDLESLKCGWFDNGTGVCCYGNNSWTSGARYGCMYWSPIEKHWIGPDRGIGTDGNRITNGQLDIRNNTFMYTYILYSLADLKYSYHNETSWVKNELLDGSTSFSYSQELFQFLNTTNGDGVFTYMDLVSAPYKEKVRRWDGLNKQVGDEVLVDSSSEAFYPYQPIIVADKSSDYAYLSYMSDSTNRYIMAYLYNYTINNTKKIGMVAKDTYRNEYINTHDFVFFPTAYAFNDTQSPWWTENKTPTGTLRKGTTTVLEVKLNDNVPQSGYYIFSTNQTGTWVNDSAVSWTPNQFVTKSLSLTSNKNTVVHYYLHFNDSNGNVNDTNVWYLTIQNTPPLINSSQPINDEPYVGEGINLTFNVTVSDFDNDVLTCNWYVNGTLNQSGTCNNFTANFTLNKGGQNFLIEVYVNDGDTNTTESWTMHVLSPPFCMNPYINTPSSPTPYVYNQTINLSTSCNAGGGTISEVWLNCTPKIFVIYDQLIVNGDIYYTTQNNLSADTYTCAWYMNTTTGERNNATTWQYVVQKANVSINFSINTTSPITYPNGLQLNCNCTQTGVNCSLYQNDTSLKYALVDHNNPARLQYNFSGNLSAGLHNFSCRSNQAHQNYTDSRNFTLFTVDKAQTTCSITFASDPVQLPDKVNATGLCTPVGEVNWTMYRELDPGFPDDDFINVTNESSNNITISTPGDYTYKVNRSDTQNFTFDEVEDTLTVLPEVGSPVCDLETPFNNTADGNTSKILNWTSSHPSESNLNETVFLSSNCSNLSLSNITTYYNLNSSLDNETHNVSGLESGKTYCWKLVCNSSGISDESETWQFTVTSPKADNETCSSSEECQSGYCDTDAATGGSPDDLICFTPYQAYLHDEPPSTGGLDTCEYATVTGEHEDCDERQRGDGVGTCDSVLPTYFQDTCDSTCNLNKSYTCRSSSFHSSCTADPECNGQLNGTGQCLSNCVFDPCLPVNDRNWTVLGQWMCQLNQTWNMLKFNFTCTGLGNFTLRANLTNLTFVSIRSGCKFIFGNMSTIRNY